MSALAARIRAAKKPDILRFSVCSVPNRKGSYSWGAATSDSEETIRLLCDMWNARAEIAEALERLP